MIWEKKGGPVWGFGWHGRASGKQDCRPPGGMGAGGVETPMVGFYFLPYPRECGFSPCLLSQVLLLLGTALAVISGVSYQRKSRVILSASFPLSKLFSERTALT